jgi:hypothetical protein
VAVLLDVEVQRSWKANDKADVEQPWSKKPCFTVMLSDGHFETIRISKDLQQVNCFQPGILYLPA